MDYFKVEFVIDERKLGTVLRILAAEGALNVMPVPVGNAKRIRDGNGNPRVRPRYQGGNPSEMFYAHLIEKGIKTFRAGDIKRFLTSINAPASSYSHRLDQLKEQGLIKPSAKRNHGASGKEVFGYDWLVVHKKEPTK